MQEQRWQAAFWLLVVGSWVTGVVYGKWLDGDTGFFVDLSQAVSVTTPFSLEFWWQPLAYFVLTVISVFALSQLGFGAGAGVFLFARGTYDSTLITQLETTVGGWSLTNVPIDESFKILIIGLILAVNLPLCLWAAHLGTQRSVYLLQRLRGVPVKPEFGSVPLSSFLMILAASVAVGLIATFLFSYA